MKSAVKADVPGVCDRRDVHCVALRGVLSLSCKKREAVCFLLLVAACQGELVSTNKHVSLQSSDWGVRVSSSDSPFSRSLRCSNVRVGEPLRG